MEIILKSFLMDITELEATKRREDDQTAAIEEIKILFNIHLQEHAMYSGHGWQERIDVPGIRIQVYMQHNMDIWKY